MIERNFAAIDRSLAALARVEVPASVSSACARGAARVPTTPPTSCSGSPRVLLAGDGDQLPVSALPVDGTFPPGTAKYEKRAIAKTIPIWDPTSASTAASARSCARTRPSA